MEPNNIFDIFFSFENPAIYGLIILLLILVLTFLIKKEYIQPLTKRQKELELENTKLMALFAEIDPDPILRINDEFKIISANNTALNIFDEKKLLGSSIGSIIHGFEFDNKEVLNNKIIEINSRHYSISARKVEALGFIQIYLNDITKRIEYENQIEQYQKNLRQLRTKLEEMNENEMQRLGLELHDGIGQNVSVIKIEIQKYLEKENSNDNKLVFKKLLKLIDNLSTEIRDISHQLRPRILNEFGLQPALSSYIDSINNNSNMKGQISCTESEISINPELELNIYRICQEAITNIVKHSECNNFFVQLVNTNDDLRIIISDDGKGFIVSDYAKNGNSSLGLLNMRERAANFSCEMHLQSNLNEGTTIFFNFPKTNQWNEND